MLKTKENPTKVTPYSRSWSLTRVGRLHEVPTTVLWLEKIGVLDRWELTTGGRTWRLTMQILPRLPAPYLVSWLFQKAILSNTLKQLLKY